MLANMGLSGGIFILIICCYLWAAISQSGKGKLEFFHPEREVTRVAPIGFSWTTLIFGFFPALFRGHFFAAFVIFVLTLITSGLAALIFPFLYNKWYTKSLINKGFKVSSVKGDFEKISASFKEELPIIAS